MRELFSSLLVLSLVSVLSATPIVSLTSNDSNDITVTPGNTVTVDLSVDTTTQLIGYIDFNASGDVIINDEGSWINDMDENNNPGQHAGDKSSIDDAYGSTYSTITANTTLYSFDITVNGNGSVSPYMSSSDRFYQDGSTYYTGDEPTMSELTVSIPEPASILLLGTAGLFLRKRKN